MRALTTMFSVKCFIAIALVLLFFSCSSKHKAQKVSEAFLRAYYVEFDFEKARSLSTTDSHQGINYKENMSALSPFSKIESPVIEVLGIEIDPDDPNLAYCKYILGNDEKLLPLQKHQGKWLVDTDDEAIEGSSASSFSGVEDAGYTSAASSNNLPTTGPGQRARDAEAAKTAKTN